LDQIVSHDFILIQDNTTVSGLISSLREKGVSMAIVAKTPSTVSVGKIIGLVYQRQIAASLTEAVTFFQE
jgi:CBS domain containing-hemolysin-like protein